MILKDLPNGIGAGTTELKVLRVYGNTIAKEYLLFFLESPYFVEEATFKGTANQQRIISGYLENKLFPLPPLSEQMRIVTLVKESFIVADKYGRAQIKLDSLNANINNSLKKSILQEAIQGKLVPQCETEESASILLQRIREEKQRLVKEGKLKKKDIVESAIFRGDDNKYYEQIDGITLQIEADYTFPDTWEVVRLAHICRLMDGEKKEGNFVCLDAKYLRGKSSGDILPKGKFVSTGDNIILVDGENSGEVFAVPHDGYMGSTFKQLWVSSNMHLLYVLYFIQFYKDLLRNSKKGAAIPHLNKEIFYSLVIGIPPYQEQERIADTIGELYARL
ncbi:MAG: type I restriction enzyme, S subunit [bacterium P3]|nr:MAG: type I restriction enzyme, S subunit [bacterium P3]